MSNKFQEHINLFASLFGKENVRLNQHMCVHMPFDIHRLGSERAITMAGFEMQHQVYKSTPHNARGLDYTCLRTCLQFFVSSHVPFDVPEQLQSVRLHNKNKSPFHYMDPRDAHDADNMSRLCALTASSLQDKATVLAMNTQRLARNFGCPMTLIGSGRPGKLDKNERIKVAEFLDGVEGKGHMISSSFTLFSSVMVETNKFINDKR